MVSQDIKQKLKINRKDLKVLSHNFHIVDTSSFAFFASLILLTLVYELVQYLHSSTFNVVNLVIAFFSLILLMVSWFFNVILESIAGHHKPAVRYGLRLGFILFVVSEVMFFFALFWTFFHGTLSPAISIGFTSPPLGHQPITITTLPLTNTFLLLFSGILLNAAHHNILHLSNIITFGRVKKFLGLSCALGVAFLLCQAIEYKYGLVFGWRGYAVGSLFFTITAFHGFHVFIGVLGLLLVWVRTVRFNVNTQYEWLSNRITANYKNVLYQLENRYSGSTVLSNSAAVKHIIAGIFSIVYTAKDGIIESSVPFIAFYICFSKTFKGIVSYNIYIIKQQFDIWKAKIINFNISNISVFNKLWWKSFILTLKVNLLFIYVCLYKYILFMLKTLQKKTILHTPVTVITKNSVIGYCIIFWNYFVQNQFDVYESIKKNALLSNKSFFKILMLHLKTFTYFFYYAFVIAIPAYISIFALIIYDLYTVILQTIIFLFQFIVQKFNKIYNDLENFLCLNYKKYFNIISDFYNSWKPFEVFAKNYDAIYEQTKIRFKKNRK